MAMMVENNGILYRSLNLGARSAFCTKRPWLLHLMATTMENKKNRRKMPFILIFAGALLIRLWFNFGAQHINLAFNSDGYEYLCGAQALEKLIVLPGRFRLDGLANVLHLMKPGLSGLDTEQR